MAGIGQYAHKLAGCSLTCGMPALAAVLQRLERGAGNLQASEISSEFGLARLEFERVENELIRMQLESANQPLAELKPGFSPPSPQTN